MKHLVTHLNQTDGVIFIVYADEASNIQVYRTQSIQEADEFMERFS